MDGTTIGALQPTHLSDNMIFCALTLPPPHIQAGGPKHWEFSRNSCFSPGCSTQQGQLQSWFRTSSFHTAPEYGHNRLTCLSWINGFYQEKLHFLPYLVSSGTRLQLQTSMKETASIPLYYYHSLASGLPAFLK